ncbi:MAG: helix-turn-helix transcriptional regulator [Lachnospiraceae bacterium]|nr:helix-turn-helix transcriptional regulator [Lachnospiraceae bacterium]
MEKFQITLASARVNAGLTQSDVAKEMHVSKQTIVNWESGKIKPKPAQFEMMCRLYKAPKDMVKAF